MHEFAIAQDIIFSLEENLKDDLNAITSIDIEVGTFSGVVTDSLAFGLEALFAEKNIKKVDILIEKNEAEAFCECGHTYTINDIFELCPNCESATREISSGTEILVRSVNLKDRKNV